MAEQITATDRTAEHYLRDLGTLLKEKALEVKQEKEAPESGDVHLGRLMALQDVIALMQEQAVTFGLPLEKLNLDDIDPHEDLS